MIESRRSVYLSPVDSCEDALIAIAAGATKSIHVFCYAFTDHALAGILMQAVKDGKAVGVVVDSTQAAGATQRPLMQLLVDNGVPLTISRSTAGGILHEKVIVRDGGLGPESNDSFVIYGSFNLTNQTAERQENWLITDNDPRLVADFMARYAAVEAFGKANVKQMAPTPNTGGPPPSV